MQNIVLLLIAAAFTILRLGIPTVGHSWPMVFIALAHMYVGMMLTLLWQRRGRWLFGWVCLLVPSLLEAAIFYIVNR